MFAKEPTDKPSGLESAIDDLFIGMKDVGMGSDEYAEMVTQLVKLYELKEIDKPKRITPDTLMIVAGNLLGIILIVGHERTHIVTSKALGFVLKLR